MLITVFTPVYNRADIIKNLYFSLRRQTVKDFEWLIIDDGSKDGIKQTVEEFKVEDNGFEIRFYSKENGGKHTCINMATDIAEGELFFIVDSDDFLSDDALEKVMKMYETLKGNNRFCGIAGLRSRKNGDEIGTTFSGCDFVDATALEREKFNISGDKAEVFVTEILKQYKFPVFEGENFITENVVWLRIADDGYKLRWFNEPIYVCEYLEGGLSDRQRKKQLKNFYGDIYTYGLYIRLYKYRLLRRIRIYGIVYDAYAENKTKDKRDFILKTLNINYTKLRLSAIINDFYKFFRREK